MAKKIISKIQNSSNTYSWCFHIIPKQKPDFFYNASPCFQLSWEFLSFHAKNNFFFLSGYLKALLRVAFSFRFKFPNGSDEGLLLFLKRQFYVCWDVLQQQKKTASGVEKKKLLLDNQTKNIFFTQSSWMQVSLLLLGSIISTSHPSNRNTRVG